jgi:rod shape-determining protein MreD
MSDFEQPLVIGGRGRRKTFRIRTWVMLVMPLAAILFQVYVPLYLPLAHYLELPLLVTVYLSISRRGALGGAVMGAAVGLIQDALSSQPIGIFGMVKTLIGYLAASLGIRLDTGNLVVRLGLGFFFFACHQILYWIARRALLGSSAELDLALMLLAGLANGLLGVLLFHLLDKLRDAD